MSSLNRGGKKSNRKVGLGKKEDDEYKYQSKIDFSEDLSVQIDKLMKEKKAKDTLDDHLEEIRQTVKQTKDKKKSTEYYWRIGTLLSFLDTKDFKNIKPYSVFRRIIEEVPDIVPEIDEKRAGDHLMMMYRIGRLSKDILAKAKWEQWYEISKFKGVTKDIGQLDQILSVSGKLTGPDLRERIRSIVGRG